MLFVLGTIGVVLFMVAVLVLVGRAYPGSSDELVHWEPTRSPELEAQNEIDDIRQMLEAQNELRRKRGAEEMTEADLEAEVAKDEQARSWGGETFGPR
jgi:hypothetical protein